MKTENLVAALVADRGPGRRSLRRAVGAALGVGLLVSLAAYLLELGVRADIAAALATWRFDAKIVLVIVALAAAFGLCVALARPLVPAHPGRRLLPLLAIAVAAVTVELVAVPSDSWATRLVGSNALLCLAAIPALALAPLAAVLAVLRSAAPASPALAGAAAGLLAAASAAVLYGFHCFDDSPLFVVTWYTLATIPVVVLGGVVGHRLLRW